MCKYCETSRKIDEFYTEGESIASTRYEGCNIAQDIRDEKYYIKVSGSYEDFSEQISYCPFCGKKLKIELSY